MADALADFIKNDLPGKLKDDVKEYKIFSESDLQCRVARHIDAEYGSKYRLCNQLRVSTGEKGANIKPDIVLFDGNSPVAVVELKCCLDKDGYNHSDFKKKCEKDVGVIKKFFKKQRKCKAFAIVLLRINNKTVRGRKEKKIEELEHVFAGGKVERVLENYDDKGFERDFWGKWQDFFKKDRKVANGRVD